jgi:DtxR family Mn-dependent transcriptional regulator
MISPYLALTVFFLLLLISAAVLWPKLGLLARYNKMLSNTKRVLMEDALKHIYDYESHDLAPTLNSIAGNLGISADKSSKIVENLKKLNLITIHDHNLSLTEEGKKYALRVIRVHRLWENYLAEETGVSEIEWHDEAEKIEHLMSKEDADRLSARMGNPKFDPHGDPIPTTDGRILSKQGKLLNTFKPGDIVKVVHIEDEPKTIYTKLFEIGLFPGKELKILEKYDDKMKIAFDGKESLLSLLDASKLSVDLLADQVFVNKKIKTLVDIKRGETAEVLSISPNCRGHQRRRLLDFGIVPGSKIRVHIENPLNDPTAYLVKETIVALRKNQADKIIIKT